MQTIEEQIKEIEQIIAELKNLYKFCYWWERITGVIFSLNLWLGIAYTAPFNLVIAAPVLYIFILLNKEKTQSKQSIVRANSMIHRLKVLNKLEKKP